MEAWRPHRSPTPARLAVSLLQLIENWELFGSMLNVDQGQQAALRAAQKVIARLRRRDLYKYCSEALVPQVCAGG